MKVPKGVYERTPANKPKPREYPPEIVELARRLYIDEGMTVAEIRAVFPKGYRVQTIIERHIAERRPCAKRDQSGERNHMWRGDDPGYQARHLRLGRAADHPCVDCGEQAREWSYEGRCDGERRTAGSPAYCTHDQHYRPRCTRCHRRYDSTARRATGEVMPNVS